MGWLAEAHADWHVVNADRPWDCPLDCYDPPEDWYEEEFVDEEVPMTPEEEEMAPA